MAVVPSQPVVQPAQQDAGKVLQDLLGLSSLVGQLNNSIVSALTSEQVKTVLTSAFTTGWSNALSDDSFENALFDVIVRILGDASLTDKMAKLLSVVLTSENAKGAIAEGVFSGMKRMFADADAQKNIVLIGNSIIASQSTANITNAVLDGFSKRVKDYFKSEDFATAFKTNATTMVATFQETLNLSIKEAIEEFKTTKLQAVISLGGSNG